MITIYAINRGKKEKLGGFDISKKQGRNLPPSLEQSLVEVVKMGEFEYLSGTDNTEHRETVVRKAKIEDIKEEKFIEIFLMEYDSPDGNIYRV